MDDQKCIAQIEDRNGIVWEYEGTINGNPIWCKEGESNPKILSESEAYTIAVSGARTKEKASVRFVN